MLFAPNPRIAPSPDSKNNRVILPIANGRVRPSIIPIARNTVVSVMGPRRKRPRAIRSKIHAECPFIATTVVPFCEKLHTVSKKRKRSHTDKDRIDFVQKSPFNPNGKFKTCQTLDTSYSVKSYKRWSNMTRYNSFVRE